MSDMEREMSKADADKERYLSTSYSNKVTCGSCGAPMKHVPVMYEHMNIDWRCGRCLRRDKTSAEDRA